MNERFKNAISALRKAFFTNNLISGSCSACAVGQIVANAYGDISTNNEIVHCNDIKNVRWRALFFTDDNKQTKRYHMLSTEVDIALQLIEPTGYSEEELARVEYSFETATKIKIHHNNKMYQEGRVFTQEENAELHKGITAVVKVLCELDGEDHAETMKLFDYCEKDFKPKYPLLPNE